MPFHTSTANYCKLPSPFPVLSKNTETTGETNLHLLHPNPPPTIPLLKGAPFARDVHFSLPHPLLTLSDILHILAPALLREHAASTVMPIVGGIRGRGYVSPSRGIGLVGSPNTRYVEGHCAELAHVLYCDVLVMRME
jgi:hypothetical protein